MVWELSPPRRHTSWVRGRPRTPSDLWPKPRSRRAAHVPTILYLQPEGFTWSIPKRFTATIAGFRWDADNVRYFPDHVHPSTWGADFYGCRTAEDEAASNAGCPTANTYNWLVAGTPVSRQSCRLHHRFADQGATR